MAEADFESSSTSNGQKAANDLCPICYRPWRSDGSHRVCCLPCGHVYGKSCIQNWLETGRPAAESVRQGELVRYKLCPQCNKLFGKYDIIELYGIGASSDDFNRETLQMIANGSSTNPSDSYVCHYCRVGQGKHTSTCKFALLEMRLDFLKNEAEFICREGVALDVDGWYERFKRVPRLSDVALVHNSDRPDVVRAQIVRNTCHCTRDNVENDMVLVPIDDDDDDSNGRDVVNVNNDGGGSGEGGVNGGEDANSVGDDILAYYDDDEDGGGGNDGNGDEDDNDGGDDILGDDDGGGDDDEEDVDGGDDILSYYEDDDDDDGDDDDSDGDEEDDDGDDSLAYYNDEYDDDEDSNGYDDGDEDYVIDDDDDGSGSDDDGGGWGYQENGPLDDMDIS